MSTSLVFALQEEHAEFFKEKPWKDSVDSVDPSLFYAPHVKDGRYFNPWMPMEMKGFFTVLKWRLSERAAYTTEEESYLPGVNSITAEYINSKDSFMSWIGHASILIKANDTVILIDPVFGEIPFAKKRRTPSALSYDEASKITGRILVLLTHNHYDHLDKKSIKSLPASARFIVPAGLKDTMEGMGITDARETDWWDMLEEEGIKITFLPSQHWSRRSFFDTNKSLWGSYLVDTGDKRIFICGDSGYSKIYREIGKKFPGIDHAFMSVGAFHPRWFMHYSHQNIEEAVQGFRDLGAKHMIPMHWGAFRLGDEPEGYTALHMDKKYSQALLSYAGDIIAF